MRWLARIGLALLLVFASLAMAEITARVFWRVWHPVPLLRPDLILYAFYPGLKKIDTNQPSRTDDVFDVLMLGGSALHDDWGTVRKALLERLESEGFPRARAFNLATPAHNSRDSWLEYSALADARFDLVLVYHGINDARANNVPPELFREDYGHYGWYDTLNAVAPSQGKAVLALPLTLRYLAARLRQTLMPGSYIPTGPPRSEWTRYGETYRSTASFEANLRGILETAEQRGDPLLLMTFAVDASRNQPRERFEPRLPLSLPRSPIEVWGEPANVLGAVAAHNEIVRQLAATHPEVQLVDQATLMMEDAEHWFNDPCHFTTLGSLAFVDNMMSVLKGLFQRD